MGQNVLARFDSLTTWSSGGQRAPRKPLQAFIHWHHREVFRGHPRPV